MCEECNHENELKPEPYTLLDIKKETEREYTFRLECDIDPDPGQFFQLSLPKIGEAPFSYSASGDDWLEITIRNVGKVTSETFNLHPGDEMFLRGPYGNSFPVDQFEGKDLVIVCGGTGVCAVKSLLQYAYENYEELNSVTFLTGFRDQDCILYCDELDDYKAKFDNTIYSLDNEDVEGFEQGFVTQYINQVPYDQFDDPHTVIVGPPPMMDAAAEACLDQGTTEDKIWISMERKMSCGIGKCGHCKVNDTYVCVDGPVFNYEEGKKLID